MFIELTCLTPATPQVNGVCYLFDRTYEGNFIKDPKGGYLADMILPPAPRPVSNIALRDLNFADSDFDYFGYQEGFSVSSTSPG